MVGCMAWWWLLPLLLLTTAMVAAAAAVLTIGGMLLLQLSSGGAEIARCTFWNIRARSATTSVTGSRKWRQAELQMWRQMLGRLLDTRQHNLSPLVRPVVKVQHHFYCDCKDCLR